MPYVVRREPKERVRLCGLAKEAIMPNMRRPVQQRRQVEHATTAGFEGFSAEVRRFRESMEAELRARRESNDAWLHA